MGPQSLLGQYQRLTVNTGVSDDAAAAMTRQVQITVQLKTYFMMNWTAGTEQRNDYNAVTQGPGRSSRAHASWFELNSQAIRTAAMGKGRPGDYCLALEWAVRSGQIANPTQHAVQTYCDQHLGIDCSGFATNYLCYAGRMAFSHQTLTGTGAASYYSVPKAINDPTAVRQGDLLVWMDGNQVKRNPGHVAVVESYVAQSQAGGNMRVVEATGAGGANPKLLESMYAVEQIIPPAARGSQPPGPEVMVLVVRRHGVSGSRVAVMRW